jgi:hypothetical protein
MESEKSANGMNRTAYINIINDLKLSKEYKTAAYSEYAVAFESLFKPNDYDTIHRYRQRKDGSQVRHECPRDGDGHHCFRS